MEFILILLGIFAISMFLTFLLLKWEKYEQQKRYDERSTILYYHLHLRRWRVTTHNVLFSFLHHSLISMDFIKYNILNIRATQFRFIRLSYLDLQHMHCVIQYTKQYPYAIIFAIHIASFKHLPLAHLNSLFKLPHTISFYCYYLAKKFIHFPTPSFSASLSVSTEALASQLTSAIICINSKLRTAISFAVLQSLNCLHTAS